jgi:hypothetical protein
MCLSPSVYKAGSSRTRHKIISKPRFLLFVLPRCGRPILAFQGFFSYDLSIFEEIAHFPMLLHRMLSQNRRFFTKLCVSQELGVISYQN